MEGWIKIHRKILDWGWYSDNSTRSLFLHLLLIANHKKNIRKGQELLPGQCSVGRKYLAKSLGLSEMQIRRALVNLKNSQEITIKTTNRFSLITICKWEEYQYTEEKTTSKVTNKQPTNNQQTTTTEEYNNEKNENKLTEFIERWNNVKPLGIEKKGLPKTKKITDNIKKIRNKKIKEFTYDDIIKSVNKYCMYVNSLPIDDKGYYKHRFTLYEFLKQDNGLEKYFNS